MQIVDGPMGERLWEIMEVAGQNLLRLAAVVIITPRFLVPTAVIASTSVLIGRIYMTAQLPVKRR